MKSCGILWYISYIIARKIIWIGCLAQRDSAAKLYVSSIFDILLIIDKCYKYGHDIQINIVCHVFFCIFFLFRVRGRGKFSECVHGLSESVEVTSSEKLNAVARFPPEITSKWIQPLRMCKCLSAEEMIRLWASFFLSVCVFFPMESHATQRANVPQL